MSVGSGLPIQPACRGVAGQLRQLSHLTASPASGSRPTADISRLPEWGDPVRRECHDHDRRPPSSLPANPRVTTTRSSLPADAAVPPVQLPRLSPQGAAASAEMLYLLSAGATSSRPDAMCLSCSRMSLWQSDEVTSRRDILRELMIRAGSRWFSWPSYACWSGDDDVPSPYACAAAARPSAADGCGCRVPVTGCVSGARCCCRCSWAGGRPAIMARPSLPPARGAARPLMVSEHRWRAARNDLWMLSYLATIT